MRYAYHTYLFDEFRAFCELICADSTLGWRDTVILNGDPFTRLEIEQMQRWVRR